MARSISPYQERRQEEERLGDLARFLSVIAATLLTMVTVQAAGYSIPLPIIG